jgi:hypothetical protein
LFGQTNFRNQLRRFGIKKDDRRRHMYIIGKTGMGKSTMMENMMLHDIYTGHGVGLVDPHGDFAEKIIDFIPSHRLNDVIYLNPADMEYPVGFNILEVKNEEQKHLIVAGLMGTFKKIWPDVWSARMEYILNNTLLALLEYPGSTLLAINRLLSEKAFRKKVLRQVKDPVIKGFWMNEFENYEPRYQKEAVAPIQNKIGQFLSASVIRNMVAQVKSTIDIREAMDTGKILIMNLSKGRIGEDNSRLLGGMLITKIQLSAMERVDIPEAQRRDFFLYVDEFQNFATPSFANILSEARKYRLGLVMAHQYVAQLDEIVADAVFGNVGTIVAFRVGAADAEILAKEFAPVFLEEDIVNLAKFRVILKLMIDGVASQPFSSSTMAPIASRTGSSEKVIRVSRERYAEKRDVIEEKIMRWSGLETGGDEENGEDIDTTKEAKPKSSGAPRREERKEGGGGDFRRPKTAASAGGPKKPSRDSDRNGGGSSRREKKEPSRREPASPSVSLRELVPPPESVVLPAVHVEETTQPLSSSGNSNPSSISLVSLNEVPAIRPMSNASLAQSAPVSRSEQPSGMGQEKKKKRRRRKKKVGETPSSEGQERRVQTPERPQERRSDTRVAPSAPAVSSEASSSPPVVLPPVQKEVPSQSQSSPPQSTPRTVLPQDDVIRFD